MLKQNIRRGLALLMALLMVSVPLAGCADSGDGEGTSDTSTSSQSPAQSTPDTTPAGTTAPSPADTSTSTKDPESEKKTLRVLFIGNSLTYYNDMPAIVMALGRAAGRDIYTKKVTAGSSTMCQQTSSTTEIGRGVEEALREKWDYVVIQPSRRITDKETTVKTAELAAGRLLDERIKATGAKTVIYGTWGNNTGNSGIYVMNSDGVNASKKGTFDISRADHNVYMQSVAREFATMLDAPMVDGAALFDFVVKNQPAINLYYSDERHPSLYGSYAIACAFYAFLYNESSAQAAAAHLGGVEPEVAQLLSAVADHIVLGSAAPTDRVIPGGSAVSNVTVEPVEWSGSGSQNDPYIIASSGNFMYFVSLAGKGESFAGKYIKQTADVDLKGGELAPIGVAAPFAGSYDGGGHEISDLSVTGTGNTGLFAEAIGASISGIVVANATFKGAYTGAIVGSATGGTVVSDCVVLTSSSVEGSARVGGIVGNLLGSTVSRCVNYTTALVKSTSDSCYVGGIVGLAADGSLIELCYNSGEITVDCSAAKKNGCAGGILGCDGTTNGGSANVARCVNTGTVFFTYGGSNAARGYTGGIVGRATNSKKASKFSDCYNTGSIVNNSTNKSYTPGIGQICGVFVNVCATLDNCFGLDTVSAELATKYGPDSRYSNYVAGKEGGNFSDSQYFRLNERLGLKNETQMAAAIAEITANIPALARS